MSRSRTIEFSVDFRQAGLIDSLWRDARLDATFAGNRSRASSARTRNVSKTNRVVGLPPRRSTAMLLRAESSIIDRETVGSSSRREFWIAFGGTPEKVGRDETRETSSRRAATRRADPGCWLS